MKQIRLVPLLLALSLAAVAGSVWAHDRGHRGPRVGVYFGYSTMYPWYGPPPYYYYPPTVIVRPAEPQVYIERAVPQPAPAPQSQAYWHYCSNPPGYYPYVKECPGGWMQVVPTPPPN